MEDLTAKVLEPKTMLLTFNPNVLDKYELATWHLKLGTNYNVPLFLFFYLENDLKSAFYKKYLASLKSILITWNKVEYEFGLVYANLKDDEYPMVKKDLCAELKICKDNELEAFYVKRITKFTDLVSVDFDDAGISVFLDNLSEVSYILSNIDHLLPSFIEDLSESGEL